MLEQIDITTTPVLLAQYTWGLDLSHTLDGAGGIGGLLAAVDTAGTASTSDDRAWWYTYDANGNVGQLLRHDAGTGAVTLAAAYEYDPYGNTLRADDLDGSGIAQANKFRFSTKYLHDELTAPGQPGALATTGLYYYGYRFYSPGLGRWISRDPIEEEGGPNLHCFVYNEPGATVDTLGDKPYSASRSGSAGAQAASSPGSQPSPTRPPVDLCDLIRNKKDCKPKPIEPGPVDIPVRNILDALLFKDFCGSAKLTISNCKQDIKYKNQAVLPGIDGCDFYKKAIGNPCATAESLSGKDVKYECSKGKSCCEKASFHGNYPVSVQIDFNVPFVCHITGTISVDTTVKGVVGQCK